jgi:uncharacterized phage protein (TIGR02218 family)
MIAALLAQPVTTLAYGWRLERRDGVTLGFTSHDRDVVFDGLLLRASPGIEPTSVVERMGFDNGGLDVRGALTSDALSRGDIEMGRWDGASLQLFMFDWNDLAKPAQSMASGSLGTISLTGDAFETVFNGPASALGGPVAPLTSPTCRANFCDESCGLNRLRFTREALAISSNGETIVLATGTGLGVRDYGAGELRWLEGPNCGLIAPILAHANDEISLFNPPPYGIDAPTRIMLVQGCDKRLETCRDRFANMVNFRGEPHLPGIDLLTRYPGAS